MGVAGDFGMTSGCFGVVDFHAVSIFVGVLASRPDSVFEGVLTSSELGSLGLVSGTAGGSKIEDEISDKRQPRDEDQSNFIPKLQQTLKCICLLDV